MEDMSNKPISIEEVKKSCNFRLAKCCSNCKWMDTYAEDFGANYQVFCGNPKNEFDDAKPGEAACISLLNTLGAMVCDNFEIKDPLKGKQA